MPNHTDQSECDTNEYGVLRSVSLRVAEANLWNFMNVHSDVHLIPPITTPRDQVWQASCEAFQGFT